MWSDVIVEIFPFTELVFQIHIPLIGQQLIEFLFVRPVRPLHLAIQVRAPGFYINMTYPEFFFQVPVELPFEFVPVIRSNGVDAERESLDHVINEVYGVLLCVALIDL